ncbi:hypothetical protein CLV63_10121 [Murinocardiopsis flavida]|uniref:Uncharacterized protein n=1 Tax=Murinocardiopsis flavida TaxID=645275 RepID=A0A2P8DTK2_9ACTN|nr:hypothetical protein [Murinocardiopsis flavida]PSL00547.1 hypothetical protein CLV63_10121 [Murinocardiopsis flavida]
MTGAPALAPGENRPGAALEADYARIGRTGDADLAADLLAGTPSHEERDRGLLLEWAAVALEFGGEMAAAAAGPAPREAAGVHDAATGGVRPGEILLAEYVHRAAGSRVVVYSDAVDYAHRVATAAGWGAECPRGAVRRAALAHEEAHRMLHTGRGRELRRRLDHTALRIGPLRLRGHVVGADEIAAHAYARGRGAMRRSPLALTAAIAATLAHQSPDHQGPDQRTRSGDRL